MGLFDWLKGKGSQQSGLEPLTDEQYKALFFRLLEGVADGWDGDRLRQVLGDRFADPQFLVWLQGYGEGLLIGTHEDLARLLVRLGEVGCGEIGVVAREFGLRILEAIATAPLEKRGFESGDDFEGVYRQGLAELDAGNYEQALIFFERAIAINENQAEVWTKRAVALQHLNRIGEAIEANQRAISLIKGNQLLATNKILNNSTQPNVESSPSIPEPVINLDDAEKWFENGNSLYFEGRYQEAIASYDNALKIKPDDHEASYNRGVALGNLGRLEKAIASYDNALKFNPDDHEVWYSRGIALADLGRLEEAITSYDTALKFKPDDHKVWYSRGNALAGLGRMEEAITYYDTALKFKPDYHQAWFNRGLALSDLGRLEEAIASFDNALKIKSDDHEAWYNRGSVLANLGRNEEAIASYDQALKFKPDDHQAWLNRGVTLLNLGKLEEAIASFDNALTLTRGKLWEAWINRSIAVAQLVRKRTFLIHSLPPAMQHPDLEEPGYPGRLACLREGLKYAERATDPEGWGQLHRYTGFAHYDYARRQENPYPFWRKAVPCYETALEALTEDQFPTAHLKTLQDLIRVLTVLQDTETAQTLLRKGTDLLERLLSQKTGAAKDQFERQFRPAFNELTVALAVQSGDWPTALEIAEQDKNALLRQGLLSNQPAQSPDYGQMQTFLQQQPQTAILYWHLSANALTTFLLI